jgi:hypothetical protein
MTRVAERSGDLTAPITFRAANATKLPTLPKTEGHRDAIPSYRAIKWNKYRADQIWGNPELKLG